MIVHSVINEGLYFSSTTETIVLEVFPPNSVIICLKISRENVFFLELSISVVVLVIRSIAGSQKEEEREEKCRSHPETNRRKEQVEEVNNYAPTSHARDRVRDSLGAGKSCFSTLFKFEEMQEIVKNFTVVHVDAPGQEDGAAIYPAGYQYASMDQISEMIPAVLQYFNFRTIIGVGVGAGAYILSKFTLSNPEAVEGLVLVNIDTNARGWMDWAAQKLSNLTSSLTDQILSHLFSQEEMSANTELIQTHRERISKSPNLINIELFWKSYQGRRDLNIDRNNTFKCPVMLVVGDQAPYEEAAVECNSKLDPTTTSFLKMADAGGMPQLTQPSKLTEAFKYFIQGMGYMASSCMTRLSRSRTTSLSSSYSMEGSRSRSRTLSQGSQGGQLPPSPSHTMERAKIPSNIRTISGSAETQYRPSLKRTITQQVRKEFPQRSLLTRNLINLTDRPTDVTTHRKREDEALCCNCSFALLWMSLDHHNSNIYSVYNISSICSINSFYIISSFHSISSFNNISIFYSIYSASSISSVYSASSISSVYSTSSIYSIYSTSSISSVYSTSSISSVYSTSSISSVYSASSISSVYSASSTSSISSVYSASSIYSTSSVSCVYSASSVSSFYTTSSISVCQFSRKHCSNGSSYNSGHNDHRFNCKWSNSYSLIFSLSASLCRSSYLDAVTHSVETLAEMRRVKDH
ncbi:hypothetical protein QQF64_031067 [Cirrhinus molitorella]|uniref:Protein NDRG2 n=1 Tax=Cirrhinus molitorella TaxID=172907 RepID=A0ABR3N589_9TELE